VVPSDLGRDSHDCAMAAITAAVYGDYSRAVAILEESPCILVAAGSLLGAVLLALAASPDLRSMEERWAEIATAHAAALEA